MTTFDKARSKDRNERNREEDSGKREQHVDRSADDIVEPSAEVARNRSEQHAEDR